MTKLRMWIAGIAIYLVLIWGFNLATVEGRIFGGLGMICGSIPHFIGYWVEDKPYKFISIFLGLANLFIAYVCLYKAHELFFHHLN